MGRRGEKKIPRRSLRSHRRWFVLVGCLCLWVLLMIYAGAFDDPKDDSAKDSSAFFTSLSVKYGCRNGAKHIDTTKEEIRSLFDQWNKALLEGDPGAVADLYYHERNGLKKAPQKQQKHKPLLLLPTLSNEPRTDLASVEDYFRDFLKRRPRGRIISSHILISPDGSWAHDAGIYEFNLMKAPDTKSQFDASSVNEEKNTAMENSSAKEVLELKRLNVRARYSFLYARDETGQWKIAHHHSSLMPESD